MLVGFFDGCCEPRNPGGHMGIGAVLYRCEGSELTDLHNLKFNTEKWTKIFEHSECIMSHECNSQSSNNIAEYKALISILHHIYESPKLHKEIVMIFGDSNLVIQQMNKRWRIKQGLYVKYARAAEYLLLNIPTTIKLNWISRDLNSLADDLSKGPMRARGVEFRIQPEND